MEEKILSMYTKGMTTGNIESHMKGLYDMDISDSTISRITDKVLLITGTSLSGSLYGDI